MPVRSSVCTYSPLAASSSRYSSSTYAPSSLSIGHYKSLASSKSASTASSRYNSFMSPSSTISDHFHTSSLGSSSRYSTSSSPSTSTYLSTSSSSSSSSSASSSSSLYSPSSHTNGHYKPLSSPLLSANGTGGATTCRYYSSSTVPSSYNHHGYSPSTGVSISYGSSLGNGANQHISSFRRPSISHINTDSGIGRKLSSSSSIDKPAHIAGLPCGLINLGNTCYMNAVLQALYSVETFRKFVLRSYGKSLTNELSDLFKQMQSSTTAASPANFKYAFSRYQSRFSGLGQQDAQEFLRYLINGVHEELNEATNRPRRHTPLRPPKNADEAWSQYKEILDDSPLVNIVVGQLCSMITCSVCQNKSYCWDPFWDLSLPLMRGRHTCKLSDVISDFCAKEVLEYDERPVCSNCKKATKSTKQISVHRLPQLLILHLKKFSNDGYKLTSPEVRIDRQLELNSATYLLSACISHHGHSSSSGHYTSHCKYSSRWFHFNDSSVRDVTSTFNEAKLDDAYVLFYQQQQTSDYSKL